MSYADTIYQTMRFEQEYTPPDLAMLTHLDEKVVGQVLHLLAKSNMIECTSNDRFRKNRKYKTRQRNLL